MENMFSIMGGVTIVMTLICLLIFVLTIVVFIFIFKKVVSNSKIAEEQMKEDRELKRKKMEREIELESNNVEYKTLNCPSCNASLPKDVDSCPFCGSALVQVKKK